MSRRRLDSDYEIETVTKAVALIEALEGEGFAPVRQGRLEQRTGLSKDTVHRTLRTLRLAGWATQDPQGRWHISRRLMRFAQRLADSDMSEFF